MACPKLDNIIEKFNNFTEKPVKFLAVQSDLKDDIKTLVKSIYDYTKSQEAVKSKDKKGALPELIVQDFDEEQIWQELELQNSECWDQLVWEVANCMSAKSDLVFPIATADQADNTDKTTNDDTEDPMEEDENTEINNSDEDIESLKEKPTKKKPLLPKSKVKPSIVDDQFFKLQEMEKFLINEEKNGGKATSDSEEESIDMFEDIDDDEDPQEQGAMYSDFFSQGDENDENDDNINNENKENDDFQENSDDDESDQSEERGDREQEVPQQNNNKKKVRFAMDDESSDDDESVDSEVPTIANKQTNEKKSDFEHRQERLKEQIQKLEERTLSEAPWQLKGEVDATKRPQNSLLEEVVDFDLTSRPPPTITEQTTVTLEDIIRRRIKDKAWDDVARKEKPVDDQLSFRKTEVLDQAKSKLSLAQVYEAEYLKQKQGLSGEVEEEKEPEAHVEVRNTMNKLFAKLDALCHYHYTPRAPQAEVKIVSNTPAISMEEVAPVATSDATLLAPEEVKKKRKGDLMSKEERTQTDKNRERRKKKKFQRAKGKDTKVTEHRNTQKAAETDDKSLKTSKAFFQQLNDDSRSLIKNKRNVKNKGQ